MGGRLEAQGPRLEARGSRLESVVVLCCLLLALTACQGQLAGADEGKAAPAAKAPLELPPFDGRVVAANATELYAPQNVFKIKGWSSESSWIKLTELVPEGTEVKEGEVVARFEFRGREALSRIKQGIQQAEADGEKSRIEAEAELRRLLVERDKRDLDAAQAHLNTLKAGAISRRQLELYQIEHEVAKFEAEAIRKQVRAHRSKMASEAAFHGQNAELARNDMAQYERYQGRFQLTAPHDGVVRHAYNRRERRKMQKGDGMASGRHVVSVARDATLAIDFYVPEHRLDELKVGDTVQVAPTAGDGRWVAAVEAIERFPQEIGFLRDDEKLPNAREKAFIVRARFQAQPEKVGAGLEVKVRR